MKTVDMDERNEDTIGTDLGSSVPLHGLEIRQDQVETLLKVDNFHQR